MAKAGGKTFIAKKLMILLASICSIIALCLNASAMGTDSWVLSDATSSLENTISLSVNYGLFNGVEDKDTGLGHVRIQLHVYCGNNSLCMLTCMKTAENREKEFQHDLTGKGDRMYCDDTIIKRSDTRMPSATDPGKFIDVNLWVTTVVFLSFTLTFQLIAVGLCCLNTLTFPSQTWLGPLGIYAANSGALVNNLLSLAIWGGLYNSTLYNTLPITDVLLNDFRFNSSNLGYSYWLMLGAFLLTAATYPLVIFRNSLEGFADKDQEMEVTEVANRNILLF